MGADADESVWGCKSSTICTASVSSQRWSIDASATHASTWSLSAVRGA